MLVPDAVEPVVGWRCWRLRDSLDGFALVSACRPVRWEPGRPLAASCFDGHAPPRSGCTCGIYAATEPRLPHAYLPPHVKAADRIRTQAVLGYDVVMAVGLAALWGEVIECDWGWRAQYAYPRSLYLPTGIRHFQRSPTGVEIYDSARLAAELSTLYGVPVSVTGSLKPETLAREARARAA
jgi:hypothetical protein